MIINYIKIAWRNLVHQKLYSLINISGLAVGLAVCMMIMMYVAHEMSYDRFHKNGERIFSPHAKIKIGGNVMYMAYMSYASGPIIKQDQPAVEAYMRTLGYFKPVVVNNPQTPNAKFAEDKLLFADVDFFKFFTFKLLSGSQTDALKKPFSVVLSSDMAKKYFGDQNPIGKTITLKTDSAYTYQVTGVAENAPSNSSIAFNFVASTPSLLAMKEATNYIGKQEVGFGSFNIYLLLKHTADTARVAKGMYLMAKRDKSFDDISFTMSSLPDTHLKNNFGDSSNTKYLKIFPLVAILILLLALVNYMSLSTARATLRAKEVGVRKVSGASRKTIAMQFYVESAVFTSLSFVLGYLLCYLFKPWFLNTLELKIDNSFLYSPILLGLLFALLVLTVIIAGSYPSLVLSAFKPVITLKGKMGRQTGGITVRKIFTTLQFAISVGLIICGIIIDRQLFFFRHADTGMNRDNIVMIPIGNSVGKNYPAFEQDVKAMAGISSVATSHYAMFKGYDMFWVGKSQEDNVGVASLVVDSHFITTLGLKWKFPPVANTDLSKRKKTIINEAAIQELHLPANPVGSFIQSGDNKLEIVGVLKNFNYSSMESVIKPLSLNIANDNDPYFSTMGCNLFVKIKPNTNLPSLLATLQNTYIKYDQDNPFSYTFMDDAFDQQYKAEDRLASIFSIFTYITIILATLGLFGLAAFTIEQRTKEIGIRKVLGASLLSINTLLSRDFLKLVILAIAIASPIAWWSMHNWLQNFAYRITISWWVFLAAGLVAIITAVTTVSYHAVRAALSNPVKSLRSE
ncbi:ABC transporter permease [Mucilaginibacter sp.]|uniref:ABC transporter permease n=1 Tax=Mucilaginibacter sp. TaxID=1882438 RepID=UPI003D0A236B